MTGGKKTGILLVIWPRQKTSLTNGYFDSSKIQTSPLVQSPIMLMSEWFSVASDPAVVLSPEGIQHLLLISLPSLQFLGILSKSIWLFQAQGPHHKLWNVFTILKNLWASICNFNINLIRKDKIFPAAFSSAVKRPLQKKKKNSTYQATSFWLGTNKVPSEITPSFLQAHFWQIGNVQILPALQK